MPSGGAPFSNEDLNDVFQGEIWAALQAMLSQYNDDAEGVIVSGCVVTPNVGNFDMTAGIVYLNGEFMRVDAVTNQTFPKYIKAATPTNIVRAFQDTLNKTFIVERKAEVSATVDGSGQEITISSVSASNDRRFSVATATKLGLTKLYANVAASNTDGSVTQAALVTALGLKSNVARSAWLTTGLTFKTNVVSQSDNPLEYKFEDGVLKLRGGVTFTSHITALTGIPDVVLPVGFRPSKNYKFNLIQSVFSETGEADRVGITTAGGIFIYKAGDSVIETYSPTSYSLNLPWME